MLLADAVGEIFLTRLGPLPKSLSQVWERDFADSGSPAPILGVGVGGRGETGKLSKRSSTVGERTGG